MFPVEEVADQPLADHLNTRCKSLLDNIVPAAPSNKIS
jgi:hypothetical protein